jgi:hypothetical protein
MFYSTDPLIKVKDVAGKRFDYKTSLFFVANGRGQIS